MKRMNKPFTFLLSFTFLFLFSGSVYGEEEVKKYFYDNGQLYHEHHFNKETGVTSHICFHENGLKKHIYHFKEWKKPWTRD
jgi:hypothetical protein